MVYLQQDFARKFPGLVHIIGPKLVSVIKVSITPQGTQRVILDISGSTVPIIMGNRNIQKMTQAELDQMLYKMRGLLLADRYSI